MKILVCGGAGFIGSTFIKNHLKIFPKDEIINIDNLSIGSNLKNLDSVSNNLNYQFIKKNIHLDDISSFFDSADLVINFAAESHVDRSISNPHPFVNSNILGHFSILENIRKFEIPLIYISTDEVYGDASNHSSFIELDSINPSNPYSATKASAENLTLAYIKTYGIKATITRSSNNFGPYQFPEKLIPKTIIRALKNLKIPVYGNGQQIRSWIYVEDHITALEKLISKNLWGEIFNITSWNEIRNIEIIKKILQILNKPESLIEFVSDRPGHDSKYSINSSKLIKMTSWEPTFSFENSLKTTVEWYQKNSDWWLETSKQKILDPQPWTKDWK